MNRIFSIFLLSGFLLSGIYSYAQLSDEAVLEYALEGRRNGKSEHQIGRELLARGVTAEQAERLKRKYEESQGSEVRVADRGISGQQRERVQSSSERLTAGSLDVVSSAATDPAADRSDPREVFGRDVFRSRTLTFEPNENQATPSNYRLGPGDEVIIDIWGENERSLREEISPEGNIMVEQVGPVYLNGLTIGEANAKLREVFGQIYAGVSGDSPASEVRVTLGRLRTIQVNVMGEVETPGTYRLSSFSTVFHALYRAGGVTPIGGLRDIGVMRGGREVARVDVYAYLLEGRQDDDVRLEEGDVVIVRPYELLVNVSGKVKRPMHYEMKRGETLGRLLDYAGGFTGDAYSKELRVIRETGREYRLYNVREGDFGGWTLEDGDAVTVGSVLDRFANRVEVRGSVYREGMYELSDAMHTVRALIERAEGLEGDAFTGRAQLLREREDLSLELLSLDLGGIMSGRSADVELRRNDVLIVPSIHELEERGSFTIGGEVARPGVYPYAAHTTIEDLVVQAGGLLDGASTVKVDVSRRMKDPKSLEPTSELGRIYTFSLKDGLVTDGDADFELAPYDIVEVRRSPGYREQRWRGGVLGRLYAGEEERALVGPCAPRRRPHAGRLCARGASDPPSERRGARSARDDAAHGPPEQPGRRFPGTGQAATGRLLHGGHRAGQGAVESRFGLRHGAARGRPSGDPGIRLHGEHLGRGDVSQYGALHGGQASEILYRPGGRLRAPCEAQQGVRDLHERHGVPREEPSQGAHRAGVRDRHPLEARAQGHESPGDHEPGHVGGVDRNDGGVDREPVEISGKDDGRDEQSDRPCGGW